MGRRLAIILLLVLAISLIAGLLPAGTLPAAGRAAAGEELLLLSPPEGLELPLGQGLAITCQPPPRATSVELLVDGVLLHEVVRPPAGRATTLAWLPQQAGAHELSIVARAGRRQVAVARRQVLVTPAGGPVRIH
jgi:hypothetical protein